MKCLRLKVKTFGHAPSGRAIHFNSSLSLRDFPLLSLMQNTPAVGYIIVLTQT